MNKHLLAHPVRLPATTQDTVPSLSTSTDLLGKDLSHWSCCQSHRYHGDVPAPNSSGHPEGKYIMNKSNDVCGVRKSHVKPKNVNELALF